MNLALIDTNSLCVLLESDKSLIAVNKLISGRRLTLHLSESVMYEILNGSNDRIIGRRLSKLGDLLTAVGRRGFVIIPAAPEIIGTELAKKITRLPRNTDTRIKTWKSIFKSGSEFRKHFDEEQLTEMMLKAKDEMLRLDKQVKQHLNARDLSATECANALRDYAGLNKESWVIRTVAEERFKSDISTETIIRLRNKFKGFRLWAMIVETNMYGNALYQLQPNHHLAGIFRTDRSSWYDANVVTPAAYMDTFITEETRLKRRCDALSERKLLHFRTTDLRTFLTEECDD